MAGPNERTAPEARPRGSFRGKAWFFVPIMPLVALDLWSKWAVFDYLRHRFPLHADGQRRATDFDFLPDPFHFTLVDWSNTGTIWGLFKDFTLPLMVFRIAALFLLVWLAWRTPATRRWLLLVLGLVFAGAVGNLCDNLFVAGGGVRDFLLFSYGDGPFPAHQFPAFNLADSCISVGAIALVFLLWRQPEADAEPTGSVAAEHPEP